ncbi:MAG TPA: HNH endonuclease [Sedimentisphaerales bacterium]|nr:HNH endonuclease [Sedimentisphaerales bacterium]
MKEIPLTRGMVTIVDDCDYEWLSQWKWYAQRGYNTFYAVRHGGVVGGKQIDIRMHRLILGLEHGDSREGDHQNHNGLDNQHSNIRIVTKQENRFNQDAKGYWWVAAKHKWVAQIQVNGRSMHIGYYTDPRDARQAYLDAKAKYHRIGNGNEPRKTCHSMVG